MYMQVTQKPKPKPVALISKLGWPSQAVPVGRAVRASKNTLASAKGAGKNQYAVSIGAEWTSWHRH
jgi:hypothetical protein